MNILNYLNNIKEIKKIDHWSIPAKITKFLCEQSNFKPNVLQLGTGFGDSLKYFCDLADNVITIDAGYDWVPDLIESDIHDINKVSTEKINIINENIDNLQNKKVISIIGNTKHVCDDKKYSKLLKKNYFDIIIVDACHHPAEEVANDYKKYFKFMKNNHYAIFDDIQFDDPRKGLEICVNWLKNKNVSILERSDIEHKCDNIKGSVLYVEIKKMRKSK